MLQVKWKESTFKALVEAVAPISDELKMTFNAEGVEIRDVDYAHVCFIKATIPPDEFVEYEVKDQVVIATEIAKLKSILKLAKKEPILMNWGVGKESSGLLHFEVRDVVKDVGLLQADLVKAPNEPNVTLPIKVNFDKEHYKTGVEAVSDVGSVAKIGFNGENAYMNCKGSNDKVEVTFNKGATTISSSSESADTNFSVDYLARILKGVGENITMELGQALPLRVSSETQGCSFVWMVAPRIDN